MNKQMAEAKFMDFIKSLRPDARHVPYAWPEEKKEPMKFTVSVHARDILDAFLRDSDECSVFRDHLSDIASKLGPQEIVRDKCDPEWLTK